VILAAPDKFRGTVSAAQAAEAIARGASSHGTAAQQLPLSDGGEGLIEVLEVLGGDRERVEVEGPLGLPTEAVFLRIGHLAILEMAQASGLTLAGGAAGNDPLRATTRGTGQLIMAAARSLADHDEGPAGRGLGVPVGSLAPGGAPTHTIVVGLGGSATTDGGLGALECIEELGGLGGVELVGACDVTVGFVEAAEQFAPQKGASQPQVAELAGRLRSLSSPSRVPAPPAGWVAPSPPSAADCGRVTRSSPSSWGSTRPWPGARWW
jgi:glycerate kinase